MRLRPVGGFLIAVKQGGLPVSAIRISGSIRIRAAADGRLIAAMLLPLHRFAAGLSRSVSL